MAITQDKSTIDLVPIFTGGDYKKVYDHGVVKFNEIVLSVFNQLNMMDGTLDDFPGCGVLASLLELYFNESYNNTINDIRTNFTNYQNKDINTTIIMDPNDEVAQLIITINNVPNFKFMADIQNKNQSIKILNPQVIINN